MCSTINLKENGENMSLKKRNVLFLLGILICICTILGVSYAYWKLVLAQKSANLLTTDCFEITFSDENPIQLNDAYPLAGEELNEYMVSATPYHFTITNVCDSMAKGYINLETLPVDGKLLSDEYISLVLWDGDITSGNETLYYPNTFSQTPLLSDAEVNTQKVLSNSIMAYKLTDFVLESNEEKSFNLLLWLDESTPATEEVMNASWEGKITVTTDYFVDGEGATLFNYIKVPVIYAKLNVDECVNYIQESQGDSSEALTVCSNMEKMLTEGYYDETFINQDIFNDILNQIKSFGFINEINVEYKVVLISSKTGGTYIDENYNYVNGTNMDPIVPTTIENYPVFSIISLSSGDCYSGFTGYNFCASADSTYNSSPNLNAILHSIVLNEGLEKIGYATFASNRLQKVVFPSTIKVIGERSFKNNVLTKVELNPKESLEIYPEAFEGNQIQEIKLNGNITFVKSANKFAIDCAFCNNPITKIVNNTGKAYNWSAILTGEEGEEFETGNLIVDGRTVEIVKE